MSMRALGCSVVKVTPRLLIKEDEFNRLTVIAIPQVTQGLSHCIGFFSICSSGGLFGHFSPGGGWGFKSSRKLLIDAGGPLTTRRAATRRRNPRGFGELALGDICVAFVELIHRANYALLISAGSLRVADSDLREAAIYVSDALDVEAHGRAGERVMSFGHQVV